MQNERLKSEVVNDIRALLSKSGYSELINGDPDAIALDMVQALQEGDPLAFNGQLETITVTSYALTNAITLRVYQKGEISLYLLSILLMMALNEAEQIFNDAENDESFVFNEDDIALLTQAAGTLVEAVQKIKGKSPIVN